MPQPRRSSARGGSTDAFVPTVSQSGRPAAPKANTPYPHANRQNFSDFSSPSLPRASAPTLRTCGCGSDLVVRVGDVPYCVGCGDPFDPSGADPIVAGGQGRSVRETLDAGAAFGWACVGGLVMAAVWALVAAVR